MSHISNQSISQVVDRFLNHINPRRRRQLFLLVALILITSIAEVISIGALFPFLSVLSAPQQFFAHPTARLIIHSLGLTDSENFVFIFTVVFGLASITAAGMRLTLLWGSTRFAFSLGSDLSVDIYRRTLYQPYSVHCTRNSSEVVDAITNKANATIYNFILPALTLVSSLVILTIVLLGLIAFEPKIVLGTFGVFGIAYVGLLFFNRKRQSTNSQSIAYESVALIKLLQEGLGGIRDILIDGSQNFYCKSYHDTDARLRRAQAHNTIISIYPRYVMEAVAMIIISLLAYNLTRQGGAIQKAVPTLGVLALCAQRLLPFLQQAYTSFSLIQGARSSMIETLKLLDQPLQKNYDQAIFQALPFNHHISLKNIGFQYHAQNPFVIKNVSLNIIKGSRVGFIGATGSGKTTLLDILMGLLPPSNGTLEVDDRVVTVNNNRAWQTHIAHVPQTVFLADTTIEQNIAFGISNKEIDHVRIRQVAQQAQLADTIETWNDKYQTIVGERGVRLSGGQRQRIGIARALYRKADVIVFDEATSALDNDTELAVIQAIESLSPNVTMLIIAHRTTTLRRCNLIVELGEGGIRRSGSYQDIVDGSSSSSEFSIHS